MKISKILAGMSAAAIAASMLAVSAVSAEEKTDEKAAAKTYSIESYSINVDVVGEDALFTAQYTSWAAKDAVLSAGKAQDIDLSPDAAEDGFTNLGYVQSAADPKEALPEGSTVTVNYITVNDIKFNMGDILSGEEDEDGNSANGLLNEWWGDNGYDIVSDDGAYVLKFASSGITLQDYKFEVPDDAIFFADQDWWGNDAWGEMNGVEPTAAWNGDGLAVSYGVDGYTADLSDAYIQIVVQTAIPLEEGTVVFKYNDMVDDGDFVVKARGDEANNTYMVSVPYTSFAEFTAKVNEGWVADGWLATQFQIGDVVDDGAKVWAYLTGVKYVEDVDSNSSEESSETESSEADSSAVDSKKADSSSKAAAAATTTNPGTGAAALAVVGVALAGAAVVTSKKRK